MRVGDYIDKTHETVSKASSTIKTVMWLAGIGTGLYFLHSVMRSMAQIHNQHIEEKRRGDQPVRTTAREVKTRRNYLQTRNTGRV